MKKSEACRGFFEVYMSDYNFALSINIKVEKVRFFTIVFNVVTSLIVFFFFWIQASRPLSKEDMSLNDNSWT